MFVSLLFFSGCIGLLPKTTAATTATVTVPTSGSLSITNLAQSGTILTVVAGGSFASGIALATGTVTGGTLSLTSLIFSGTSLFQNKDVNLSVLSNLQLAAGGSLTVPNGMSISWGPSSGILLGGSSAVINVGSSATQGGILGATGGEIRVDSVFASRGTLTVNTGTATADTVSAAYLDLGAKLDLVKNGRGLLGLGALNSLANGGSIPVFSGTTTVTAGTLLLGDNFLSDGTSNSLKFIPATSSTSCPVVVALQGYASVSSLLTSGGSATNVILGVSTDATSGQLVINNVATDNSIFKGILADAVDGTPGFQMFVTKNGEGSLLLSNASSSFTGGLTLNAGSLIVNADSSRSTDSDTGTTVISGPLGGGALNLRGGTLFAQPPYSYDLSDPLNPVVTRNTSILLHNQVSFFQSTDSDVATGGSLVIQRKATFASSNGTDTLTLAGVMDLDSNAGVTSGGSVTLVVNTPTVISGAITGDPSYGSLTGGSMSLVKSGSAQLTLSGGNQYLGNFTVSQGTLLLGSAGALGINDPDFGAFSMNSLTVSSGGVLDLGGFTSSTSTPLILSGTGAGSGALTNSGVDASTYSGSLTLATASGIGGAGDIILSGSVASAYDLTKLGTNMLTFGGTSTFSGSLQASAGITTISSTGTFEFTSTGGLVGNLTNNGVLRFNSSADRTVAGTISGTGSLVKVGASNLTLPGSTYTGATTISSGSLTVKGALSTSQISNSGTFNWSPTNSVFTGSLSGSGKTILTSTSTVTLTLGTLGYTPTLDGNIQVGSNVTLAVNAGARLSGSIEVLSGGAVSLASGVSSVFGSTTKLTVNGGVVDLKGNTVSVGSLTLLNGGTFISSSGTAKITFSGGTLSVAPSSLVITSQPQSQTVVAGSSALFSVSASGTGPLSFQWKKDGSTILTGGTSSTYTIPAATAANAGSYSVVVTNSSGSVSSGSATLTVNTPVSITSQPASVTVTSGSSASFSVTATGTAPLTYQWKKDGTSITGGTSSTYTIPAATATNAGTYSVVVTNLLGSLSSASATLSINTPVSITGQPASATVTAGSSTSFSVAATGTGPISYQWKKGNSLITAGTSATYTIASAVNADAGVYSVLVSNLLGSVSSGSATLTVNTPVTITSQPASVAVTSGSSASFSVTATGTAPFTYQWSKNGSPILTGGTSSTYTIPAATAANAGTYSVAVTNLVGNVTSANAILTVNTPVSITSQPASVTVTSGSSASFSVTATGTAPFTYQWSKNGSPITGGTSSTYTIPAATDTNAGTYSVVVTNLVGNVSSANAILAIKMPINISKQPSSLTMVAKTAATLRIAVDQTGTSAPIDFEIFSITSGTLSASSGIKGTVPSGGTLDISLKDLTASGSYKTRFTTSYNGSPYIKDSDQFNVTLRTWDDAAGTYSTTLNTDPSSPDPDEATYRGVLNVTISRTGAVSGKLIYTEAAYSSDGALREYRPVTRSFKGGLTASAQDPTKFTLTPVLGTATVADHQSLTITLDFASTDTANADGTPGPVALFASLVDTHSGGKESPWLSSSDPYPSVRGSTKLPSSLSSLQGKYVVLSDDRSSGKVSTAGEVLNDTRAYSLIQVLASGKLIWTTRSPGYLGTGGAMLNGFDLTTLVAPFCETRSATSYRQSLYGWINFTQDDNLNWKAAIGSGDAGAKLEKLYYCKNSALDGGTQSSVVALPFNDGNGCRWAGSAAPSIPAYLTASTVSMLLNDPNPDLDLDYTWIPTFSASGTVVLTSSGTKPSALQLKLYKTTGELKGSFIGSDKKRRNISGVAFGLDFAARGWVETGTFPNLQLSDWSISK